MSYTDVWLTYQSRVVIEPRRKKLFNIPVSGKLLKLQKQLPERPEELQKLPKRSMQLLITSGEDRTPDLLRIFTFDNVKQTS